VIAINDTGGVKQASHLLKYDSILGTFDATVKPVGSDIISVDGKEIKVVSDRNLPTFLGSKILLQFHTIRVYLHTKLKYFPNFSWVKKTIIIWC